MLPMVQETRRTAADYGVASFHVSLWRLATDEMTDFLFVTEIVGSESLWLRVAPQFRKPGGIVYLPAGEFEWRFIQPWFPARFPFETFRTKDHPAFRQEAWLKTQQECAHRVFRWDQDGYVYAVNLLARSPYLPPERWRWPQ